MVATANPQPGIAKNGVITENVLVRDGMGVQTVQQINADLHKEYVSSRLNIWGSYIAGIRALPQSLDDITRDLGVDLYERMTYDPETASLVNTLKAATLSQPVDVGPAVRQEDDPDYKMSLKIHDHFERVFKNLKPSLSTVLDNMLDALFVGNKIAEKVYIEGTEEDAGLYVLAKLSVKHRSVVYFVTNRFGDTVGFIPALTTGGLSGLTEIGVSLISPTNENLIPRDKFAVLAFRPKDGDPRGSSILRPAYNAWWLKMQIWPELLKYLAQFGGPAIIGFTSPDSRDLSSVTAEGSIIKETPEQVMLAQLEQWRNGAAAAFPAGSLVEIVQAVGNGEAFLKSVDLLDRQISKAVTGQELATGEGKHQARSASEVHQDILELVITFIKKLVCDMLVEDVMKPAISMNFGEQYLRLCPTASLGEVRKQDKAAMMVAYTGGGYKIDPSQWMGIDEELNVPSRDPASIQKAVDAEQQLLDAKTAPPPTPTAPAPARRAA